MMDKALPSLPQENDFRLFLQSELARRCKNNPKYSLRSFARFLSVEPSFLSKLLRGHRSVTPNTLANFSNRLGLSPMDVERFQKAHPRKRRVLRAANLNEPEVDFNQMTIDQFQMVADWYHHAILELLVVTSFEPSVKWVARVLGIAHAEAQAAVERLQRLGHIQITPEGKWLTRSEYNTTTNMRFTTVALRNCQRQMLQKGIEALENIPFEERDQSTVTLAMDSRLLEEVRARVKAFRREILKLYNASERRDQVYNLSIAFYPLMKGQDDDETGEAGIPG